MQTTLESQQNVICVIDEMYWAVCYKIDSYSYQKDTGKSNYIITRKLLGFYCSKATYTDANVPTNFFLKEPSENTDYSRKDYTEITVLLRSKYIKYYNEKFHQIVINMWLVISYCNILKKQHFLPSVFWERSSQDT